MYLELICLVLVCITVFSLLSNIIIRLEYKKRLQRARKDPAPSVSAQAILHDLTAEGRVLLRVERMAPEDIFIRSPRDL